MRQFGKILKFELNGYLRNKLFVGITLFLVIAIAVTMFIPNIISFFKSNDVVDDNTELPTMLISSEDEGLTALVRQYFENVFTGYKIEVADVSTEQIKEKIISGEAECAFVLNSAASYTYYVNNLSMYDVNSEIAEEALQEIYRLNTVISSGVSAEQASQIFSVQVEGNTEALGKDQSQTFFYTYIMIMTLYMVILLYGQMIASNVATEKSSRAMELLVTSAKPTAMMFGKVIASCIAGFTQLMLVFGSAILFYNINKKQLDNPIIASIFNIPIGLFAYMILFFILGFLMYAFMLGAIGSTASKLEDINTSTLPVMFMFIIAFVVVIISIMGTVENTALIVCSYIPFTSPMAMFARICMSSVEWYKIAVSVAILGGSTVGIGFLAARIYRVGVLLYGVPPKFTNIMKAVFKS